MIVWKRQDWPESFLLQVLFEIGMSFDGAFFRQFVLYSRTLNKEGFHAGQFEYADE